MSGKRKTTFKQHVEGCQKYGVSGYQQINEEFAFFLSMVAPVISLIGSIICLITIAFVFAARL